MSASLVGSEMCIRDSVFGDSSPTLRSGARGGGGTGWQLAFVILGLSAAVSYTHLTLPTICSV
eukprot:5127874-Alexandrium_andersonii.AAC.1